MVCIFRDFSPCSLGCNALKPVAETSWWRRAAGLTVARKQRKGVSQRRRTQGPDVFPKVKPHALLLQLGPIPYFQSLLVILSDYDPISGLTTVKLDPPLNTPDFEGHF